MSLVRCRFIYTFFLPCSDSRVPVSYYPKGKFLLTLYAYRLYSTDQAPLYRKGLIADLCMFVVVGIVSG